ncbi:hypothetical protein T02_13677 [Trichinella nativa]|uniref:Uncharacterized protein n=1 Tax=Trichinella nativa TaxID=6335 RepID=A0A0V1KZC3_9BILA|nr:hypothetical protein T02_13677 [Trichinella nativa]KRZ92417.1 hypothetical protein T08_12744 [Trichinella sp. T8]
MQIVQCSWASSCGKYERQRLVDVLVTSNVDQWTNESGARAFKSVQLTWSITAEEMRIQFRH